MEFEILLSCLMGQRPFGVRVYKTKKDLLCNIEIYEARLVAKRFTQKEEIDYKKTFSLVSKKYSISIILTLIAHFDFELQ